MPFPLPLDTLLNQGAVFLHKELILSDKPQSKYLVYLNSKIYPAPLFFILTTTDKKRKIPLLSKTRQDDILIISPNELEFFKSKDHTFIDINNFKDIDKPAFENDYFLRKVEYVGLLESEHIEKLLGKVKNSKILQPEYRKRILGY